MEQRVKARDTDNSLHLARKPSSITWTKSALTRPEIRESRRRGPPDWAGGGAGRAGPPRSVAARGRHRGLCRRADPSQPARRRARFDRQGGLPQRSLEHRRRAVPGALLHRHLPALLRRGPGRRSGAVHRPRTSSTRSSWAGSCRRSPGWCIPTPIPAPAAASSTTSRSRCSASASSAACSRPRTAPAGRRRWTGLLVAFAPALILGAFINWDLIAMALSMAALAAWAARRPVIAGALLGLAIATKFYPVICLVPLLRPMPAGRQAQGVLADSGLGRGRLAGGQRSRRGDRAVRMVLFL